MARDPENDPVLITEAEESLDDQHRARVRKYLILMAFRVPALVVAGIAYAITGSGWLAIGIIAASVPLPWVAVLIANDRPPRKRGEAQVYKYAHTVTTPALAPQAHQIINGAPGTATGAKSEDPGDNPAHE